MKNIILLLLIIFYGEFIMPNPTQAETPKTKAQLRFLFRMANDPVAIHDFYCNKLGLECSGDPREGYVDVNLGALSIIFFKSDYEIKTPNQFAWQPGYQASDANLNSLSIAYFKDEDFRLLIKNLKASDYPMFNEKPEWRRDSYWGITVRDPMNTTLELYFVPFEKPDSFEWK